mmetsp:Transcript_44793/g.136730  ORF Transcript_44793/g.136730 Transcript_44793/m.136730 type:complete len:245 (-) Transcript_44793:191-925(-)
MLYVVKSLNPQQYFMAWKLPFHMFVLASVPDSLSLVIVIKNLSVEESGERVGWSGLGGGLELGEGILGGVDVRRRVGEVVVHRHARAVLIQDVRDPPGEQSPRGLGHAERLPDLVPLVGEDGKVEPELGRELLLRFGPLAGHADHVGAEFLPDGQNVLVEALGLDGASGGGIGGVEVYDEGLVDGGAGDGLAVLIGEAEVGGGLSHGEVEGGGDAGLLGGRLGCERGGASEEGGEDDGTGEHDC